MTTEDRIRQAARKRVRVSITTRTRSKTGFIVEYPEAGATYLGQQPVQIVRTVPTKAEALVLLLARVRVTQELVFSIKPDKRHNVVIRKVKP